MARRTKTRNRSSYRKAAPRRSTSRRTSRRRFSGGSRKQSVQTVKIVLEQSGVGGQRDPMAVMNGKMPVSAASLREGKKSRF